jgi:hypothetical protein
MIFDSQPVKPSLLDQLTPRNFFIFSFICFSVTTFGVAVMILLAFVFFSARESDIRWFFPLAGTTVIGWFLSALMVLASIVVRVIHFYREKDE